MNPLFVRGLGVNARLVLLVVASIVLMSLDHRFGFSGPMRQGFSALFLPFHTGARAAVGLGEEIADFFTVHRSLQQSNSDLRRQALRDAADLQKMQALRAENAYMRRLLGIRPPAGNRVIAAEILYVPRQPFNHKIVIDRGAVHGIEGGQAVIDDRGVLGQVTRVLPATSEVTLLIDRGMAAPVEVVRSGMRAMVAGTGEAGRLEVPYLSLSADIEEGDELVTSGIDGTWPRGLPVAVVTEVERRATSTFARILCVPHGGISRHGQLLVLVPQVAASPEQR
jgi:rod shape-determining protein MreC